MFDIIQEELPDHSVIRMKLVYHVYEELEESSDEVLTTLIYPIEDIHGNVADFDTMNRIRKRIEASRDEGIVDIHSNSHHLYYNDIWGSVVGIWAEIRHVLNQIELNDDRLTINYQTSSMEYEIIVPSTDHFPYTTIVSVGLKDIGLLKALGFNDLSIVTDYLKKLQFDGDSGSISMLISFIYMIPDTTEEVVDSTEVIDDFQKSMDLVLIPEQAT